MKVRITKEERTNLKELLSIVQDETRSIMERSIARDQFEVIYNRATQRTYRNDIRKKLGLPV